MPLRLPPVLLVRRLAQQCLYALIFVLRAIVVGTIWLAVLPWATVWTWRMYFTMGDSTYVLVIRLSAYFSDTFERAWWISDRPRPSSPKVDHKSGNTVFHHNPNLTVVGSNNTSAFSNSTFVEWTMSRPFWRAISADIFAGQIIATFIVLTFVAVFLLREWISQNARPGVFEDEEFPEENRDIPPLEPVGAEPQGQPQALPLPAPQNAAPTLPHPVARGDRVAARGRGARKLRRHPRGRSPAVAENILRRRREKGKGKARDDESAPESDSDHPAAARARARRRLHSGLAASDESEEELEFSRNLRDIVGAAAMRRAEAAKAASTSANPDEGSKFQFTFRVSPQLSPQRRSISECSSSFDVWSSEATGFRDETKYANLSPSSSSDTLSSTTSPQAGTPSLNPSATEGIFAPHPSTPSSPVRRPPLLSATFLTPNGAGTSSPPPAVGSSRSGAQTPLASPSLATYRAPEELEEGPSTLAGYFNPEGTAEAEMKMEHEMYFRAAGHDAGPLQPDDISALHPVADVGEGNGDHDHEEDEDDDDYEHVLADDDDDESQEDADALEFDEAEWDEGDEDQEEGEREPRQVDQGLQQPRAPGHPAPIEVADVNDDLDGNGEDDMEGAMEAIGMRGPIYGVVQNVCTLSRPPRSLTDINALFRLHS